jgi:hypothetical protein
VEFLPEPQLLGRIMLRASHKLFDGFPAFPTFYLFLAGHCGFAGRECFMMDKPPVIVVSCEAFILLIVPFNA